MEKKPGHAHADGYDRRACDGCGSGDITLCNHDRGGLWNNRTAFLHNLLSILLVRAPDAYFASMMFTDTLLPRGLAAPGGSLLSVIICIGTKIRIFRVLYVQKIQ